MFTLEIMDQLLGEYDKGTTLLTGEMLEGGRSVELVVQILK